MSQIIYGIHPVKEALKSPHVQFQKILIGTQKPHPRIQSILALASKSQVPVTFTTKETLYQMVKNDLHQNVVGIVKDMPILERAFLTGKKKGGRPFSSFSTASRIHKILVPSSARPWDVESMG
jgi:23S rRNA (guanosine2251-2'-O)-methyltransferase